MKGKIPYRFPIFQIRDKIFGDVHTYGTDSHDALMLDENGNVMYYNLQNGGSTGMHGEYEFVYTPDEGGYGGIKEVYSEWDSPRNDKKYDEMSKEKLFWQCMLKDLQIRDLMKAGCRMKLKCLGSGSSGNCYILENDTEALIIEVGLPFREVKKALDFNVRKIVGAICSHGHKDHSGFIKEYEKAGIPVFKPYDGMTDMNLKGGAGFKIQAFDLVHDVPCYGFYISHPDIGNLIYASDTEYIKWRFRKADHILVEANYSKKLLDINDEGVKRNHVLAGHMEIDTTCGFLNANKSANLRNVVLIHLSEDNADAEQFKAKAEKVVDCPVYVAKPGLEIELGLPF